MPIEFDVKLEVKDMYRFSMYHTYTGFQGILSIVIGLFAFIYAGMTAGKVSLTYTLIYILFGVVFLIYMPVSVYMNSKRQILMSDVLKNTLHYALDEDGITTAQGEQTAQLPWKQIYKIVETKSNILVYSSRRNAYVIPQSAVIDKHDDMITLMQSKMEKFRIKVKK